MSKSLKRLWESTNCSRRNNGKQWKKKRKKNIMELTWSKEQLIELSRETWERKASKKRGITCSIRQPLHQLSSADHLTATHQVKSCESLNNIASKCPSFTCKGTYISSALLPMNLSWEMTAQATRKCMWWLIRVDKHCSNIATKTKTRWKEHSFTICINTIRVLSGSSTKSLTARRLRLWMQSNKRQSGLIILLGSQSTLRIEQISWRQIRRAILMEETRNRRHFKPGFRPIWKKRAYILERLWFQLFLTNTLKKSMSWVPWRERAMLTRFFCWSRSPANRISTTGSISLIWRQTIMVNKEETQSGFTMKECGLKTATMLTGSKPFHEI